MNQDKTRQDKILEFWNQRAGFGVKAGSDDHVGKELEVAALSRHLRDGMAVAEFGCGNGMTAIALAKAFDVRIVCFDFAPAMVDAARALARESGVGDRLMFGVADVADEPGLGGNFDVIYTQRMIINLPNWASQARAIRYLLAHVKKGGHYLMCENSARALAKLNELRQCAGLHDVTAPWHNVYLDDVAVAELDLPDARLTEVEPFMGTYYFLSRVVNAWLAQREGKQPAYDAPVNELALRLPAFGDWSQTKLWVFQRNPG